MDTSSVAAGMAGLCLASGKCSTVGGCRENTSIEILCNIEKSQVEYNIDGWPIFRA